MTDELTADDIRTLLELEPNATCRFVRITYVSPQSIASGGLPSPFSDGRPIGSALYFMVTPTAPGRLHRIRNDQLYHYYLGDPLEVFLLRSVAGASVSSSARTCAIGSASSCSFRETPSIRRGWWADATGFWVRVPSGRESFPPTWKSVMSMNWRKSIRRLPPRSAS